MWEAKDALLWCCVVSPLKILWESLRIVHGNKLLFCAIFSLTTLPLSFLTFAFVISTHPLRTHVHHLEAVARVAHTRVEARHVWHESRHDAVHLVRMRALFSLLVFPFSLAAVAAAVHAAAAAFQGNPASAAVFSAVRRGGTWKRPAVTVIFVYVILMGFAPVPRVLTAVSGSAWWAWAFGLGVEVYLMAVMGLGLVVSVAEERMGWEAIRVGSGLMKGRRFSGWVLSGLLVSLSGFINEKLETALFENNEVGVWDKVVVSLMCWYAVVVLLSYVVTTVFYCDSRRRLDIKEFEEADVDVEVPSALSSL
ncbi:hypothetical protein Fmac_032681 [Flemingia macrophylla]|uniref:Transmembrane protein n=1 Tax=Flemingia macrophylla TaxID=520843 RepID=A0ABD1L5L2_9FABA